MWEVFASGALGAVYQDISERLSEQTDEYHAQALRLLDTPMGMPAGGMAWADLGFCLLRRGNVALAVEMLQKGLTTPTIPGLLNRPRFLIGLAYVALAQNDLGEAARRVDQARAYVEERAMKHLYPEVAFAEAKVSEARGEHERALEQCAQVEAAAQDMTMRPIAWQVRVEAANVLTRLGRAAEAEVKRREACVIVDEIAGLFTDETLRAMFVQSAKEKIDLQ
jgi:tetratricopeptide (TPR) repeat protein